MIERAIRLLIEAVFSLGVIAAHVVWFMWYMGHQWTANQTTNLLSWEAIFISLFIGYTQKKQHRNLFQLFKPSEQVLEDQQLSVDNSPTDDLEPLDDPEAY